MGAKLAMFRTRDWSEDTRCPVDSAARCRSVEFGISIRIRVWIRMLLSMLLSMSMLTVMIGIGIGGEGGMDESGFLSTGERAVGRRESTTTTTTITTTLTTTTHDDAQRTAEHLTGQLAERGHLLDELG